MTHRTYLGDGVYVCIDEGGRIVLTTENGVEVTNTIVLEFEVFDALIIWMQRSDLFRAFRIIGLGTES